MLLYRLLCVKFYRLILICKIPKLLIRQNPSYIFLVDQDFFIMRQAGFEITLFLLTLLHLTIWTHIWQFLEVDYILRLSNIFVYFVLMYMYLCG